VETIRREQGRPKPQAPATPGENGDDRESTGVNQPRFSIPCSLFPNPYFFVSVRRRMDLRDVPARKLHDRGLAPLGHEWRDENADSNTLRFFESRLQIVDLVAGVLAAVRIRKMTVRYEHLHLAKARLNANAPVGRFWTANFDSRGLCVV
jgi:hypothetical protein